MTRAPGRVILTQAKIRLPIPPASVARPRLDGHAGRIIEYPITIVAAGAGFGKTTILHAWAKACSENANVAWLGLDEGDASVRAFAAYLDASLRRALPGLGPSIASMLEEGANESATIARALANELYNVVEDDERHTIVFLDDFHTVQQDAGVRDLVGELLRVLPPRVHLVIASRFPCDFSPLVKLRGDRRVADFDHNDLRFRGDETIALLADAGISKPDSLSLDSLLRRTDGWAMALRLATQAANGVRPDDLYAQDATERSLFAYLAEEVLRAQPPFVRDDLLACSILKHLDPVSISIATERDGEAVLERLLARNLYLETAGERRYRFHNLFREFLLQTFERDEPERMREIRLRYANLLRERGDQLDAASQFIQAGEFFLAADELGPAFRAIRWGDDFERIARVLDRMPENFMRQRPDVLRLKGNAQRRNLEIPAAIATLERAVAYAEAKGDRETAGWGTVDLALLYDDLRIGGYGRYDRSIAMCHRAIDISAGNPSGDRVIRSALAILALGHSAMFKYDQANEYVEQVMQLELAATLKFTDIFNTASYIYGRQGRWARALELAELSEDTVRETGLIFVGRALRLQALSRLYLRDDLPRALEIVSAAIETERAHNQWDNVPETYVVLARVLLAQDVPDIERAHAALDEAQSRLRRWQNRLVSFELLLARREAYSRVGNMLEAERTLALARTHAERYREPIELAALALHEGIHRHTLGDLPGALERFEIARDAFIRVRNEYDVALASLAAGGVRAVMGSMTPEKFRAIIAQIEREGQQAAAFGAPRSSSALLDWSLRNGCEIERAIALLEPGGRLAEIEPIRALAADPRALTAARVAAVGIFARSGVASREALERLADLPSAPVAAAATTALGLMPASAHDRLSLWVVGTIVVHVGEDRLGERDARWSRRKAVEMLRYLALAERPVPKALMIRDLWPDATASSGETSLRVALHALRRALQPTVDGAGDYVEYDGATLTLRPQTVLFIDAHEALRAFRTAGFERARGAIEEARPLYLRALDLLGGIQSSDGAPAWIGPYSQTWRDTLLTTLRALAEIERSQGDLRAGRAFAERALTLDPLDERSVKESLEVALAEHDTERARSIFQNYRRRLHDELQASPSRELLERYGRILEGANSKRDPSLSARDLQLLSLVSRGRSSKQIAAELGVSPATINAQISRILRKLRVESRAAAVAAVSGFLEP